jgi:hypothetical protein
LTSSRKHIPEESVDLAYLDLPFNTNRYFEFQNWAVIALGGIPNRVKLGNVGIDGRLHVADVTKERKGERDRLGEIDPWYPTQVKRTDQVGRPDIDNFETAMPRDKRRKGYFVDFDFSRGALARRK